MREHRRARAEGDAAADAAAPSRHPQGFPATTWSQAHRARPGPSLRPDRSAAQGPCAAPTGTGGRHNGTSGNPSVRTLNEAMAMRSSVMASGNAVSVPGPLRGRCDDSTGGHCTVTFWRDVMTGRPPPSSMASRAISSSSLSFAYTPAFLGNFLVPKTIDVGAGQRARAGDPDQRDFARPVRDPAQRHGAASLQALVDAHRSGFLSSAAPMC